MIRSCARHDNSNILFAMQNLNLFALQSIADVCIYTYVCVRAYNIVDYS